MTNSPLSSEDLSDTFARLPVIDPSTFESVKMMLGDDAPSFIADLVQSYCEDFPGLMEGLQAAIATQSPPAVQSSAHAVKSSSVTLGVLRVARLAEQIEKLAKQGDLSQALNLTQQIEAEYAQAQTVLATYMQ